MVDHKIVKNIGLYVLLFFQLIPVGILLYNAHKVGQWNDESGWISDLQSGCKYFTNENYEHRHIEWDGDCQNGLAHGQGQFKLYEGGNAIIDFEGNLVEGKIQGSGRMLFLSDGDVYEGQFLEGRIHGYGHFYNDDGDHFEGNYTHGMRNGFGTYWYVPDHPILKYQGEWKDSRQNGLGAIYYRSGKILRGHFEDGELVNQNVSDEPNAQSQPRNILITNDDGIEDMDRLVCLAEELSRHADQVLIAVSNQNRSGTSNMMSFTHQGYLETKCLSVDTAKQIYIYEISGYPADCIMFGALGFFLDQGKSIDLVISGINGGANHGAAWFGSGTIGAARTAALAKIPAIAISGIDEDIDNSENLKTICKWVGKLVRSGIAEHIGDYEYLTISIPENLQAINGVKVVERAITFDSAPFYFVNSEGLLLKEGETQTWQLSPADPAKVYNMNAETDVTYYYQDHIVIVPMTVNENNRSRIHTLKDLEQTMLKFEANSTTR